MRSTRVSLTFAPIAIVLLASCSSSTGGSTNCTVDTGSSSLGNVQISVEYQATQDGDGHMTSLTYTTDAGDSTVNNPTLPFNHDVTLTGGTQARIHGNVVYTNGHVEVQYNADAGGGNVQQGQNECGGGNS